MDAIATKLATGGRADEWESEGDGFVEDFAYGKPIGFALPNVEQPREFLRYHTDDHYNRECTMKINHGTTTLAFKYQGGIVVSVDSRASAGSWIASQTVKKIIEINPFLLGTMAGGAADCQFWETYLGMECRLHELRNKERISVAAASKILANIMYSYKGTGLSMGTMIAGTGKGGLDLFYVDNDGMRLRGDLFCVGSGQTYAYGVLDSGFRFDMSKDEALALGRRAIVAAGHRDAMSGGRNNLYHIDENGWVFHGALDLGPGIWDTLEAEGTFSTIPR